MEIYKIQEAFMELSGLGELESLRYKKMLILAGKHVEKRVRPNVDLEANEQLLVQFAASMAYYHYMVLQSQKAKSVSALDLRIDIDFGTQLKAAQELKNEMLLLTSELLMDRDFVFSAM